MYSHEIQALLENKSYKLTLEEYNSIVSTSPQISREKLEMFNDLFHKKELSTNDGYSWGIYILNYNVDASRISEITY